MVYATPEAAPADLQAKFAEEQNRRIEAHNKLMHDKRMEDTEKRALQIAHDIVLDNHYAATNIPIAQQTEQPWEQMDPLQRDDLVKFCMAVIMRDPLIPSLEKLTHEAVNEATNTVIRLKMVLGAILPFLNICAKPVKSVTEHSLIQSRAQELLGVISKTLKPEEDTILSQEQVDQLRAPASGLILPAGLVS